MAPGSLSPLRVSLKALLSSRNGLTEIRCLAPISSKAMRGGEPLQRPKPWPYKEKTFRNWHAYIDGTNKRFDENSRLIVVEGLPCIGKTEAAKQIAEEFEMLYLPMVTMSDYYINSYGYDLRQLDAQLPPKLQSFDEQKFLKNPAHDNTPFMQFTLYNTKYIQYMDALAHILNTGQGVVIERSCYSDMVFAEALRGHDWMTKDELTAYYQRRKRSIVDLMKPNLVVYLDASPDTVLENLKARGKGEEKVYGKKFLEIMEKNYKDQFLQSISEHAEILVYDWNVPGDAEAIVEDIENIDFDRFDKLDAKMADWRCKSDWDWAEKRWQYTDNLARMRKVLNISYNADINCPRLYFDADESAEFEKVWDSAPGMKYSKGWNKDQGDSIFLKHFPNMFFKKKPGDGPVVT